MSRVELVDSHSAPQGSRAALRQIEGAFGAAPHMFRVVANSPAALASMWSAFGALGAGKLGPQLGEQIAVAVAERNGCEYCLAAHTALGRKAGLSTEEMAEAQLGRSKDARTAAALSFALKLVTDRGQVSDADVDDLRRAGFDSESIVEIVAHVALNLYTNYINVALKTPVDFPAVKLRTAA